jgi:hypothetical protein
MPTSWETCVLLENAPLCSQTWQQETALLLPGALQQDQTVLTFIGTEISHNQTLSHSSSPLKNRGWCEILVQGNRVERSPDKTPEGVPPMSPAYHLYAAGNACTHKWDAQNPDEAQTLLEREGMED